MTPLRFVLSLIALLSIDYATAFAPSTSSSRIPSSLNLVQGQGRQLVAYSQAYHANKAKESASKASNLASNRRRREDSSNNAEGARGLLKNVTRLLGVGGNTKSLQPPSISSDSLQHGEGEVVYPLVGFKLVDGRALSTEDHVACSLHLPRKGVQEEVVGWYNMISK